MASASTALPILPKLPPPMPLYLLPVTISVVPNAQAINGGRVNLQGPTCRDKPAGMNITVVNARTTVGPPVPPPPPPAALLKRCKRRLPILIDQRSLKKNLQSNKQALQVKLARRPKAQQLIDRNILHNSGIDPLVQVRGQLLKRNKLADNLNSKLRTRPGPLELVTRKILQVDADLEQALQEGRVLFTPTSSVSSEEVDQPAMISTQLPPSQFENVTPTPHNPPAILSGGPNPKMRKKSQPLFRTTTPYDSINTPKLKLKNANGKRPVVDASGGFVCSPMIQESSVSPMETDDLDKSQQETNYEITLKQQQIFLQWQEDHYKNPNSGEINVMTPAMSSTTSSCSTPLQSTDAHSTRSSSFSVSSTQSTNPGMVQFSSACSPRLSPTTEDHSSNSSDAKKSKSKLSDFKVSDLKNECKKRNLPVSGSKSQLLERLKPYEETIVACTGISTPSSETPEHNGCVNTFSVRSANHNAHDVIHDYLKTYQPSQQNQPLILQFSGNSKPPQVVQLVDSNGSVVGVATMPCTTTQTVQQRTCNCDQCNSDCFVQNTSTAHVADAAAKSSEPTFSFSQMGSGGQFTLVETSSSGICTESAHPMAPNCAGCIAAASQSAMKIVASELASTNVSRPPIMLTSSSPVVSTETSPPTQTFNSSGPKDDADDYDDRCSLRATTTPRRHSIPAFVAPSVQNNREQLMSPHSTEQLVNTNVDTPSDTEMTQDDIDDLLTAKTFTQHEENLRLQHSKIEDLQAELTKAQEQLRREQKLIIAAKKRQLVTDKRTGKQVSPTDVLLNSLDVKQFNKLHIQRFLQHKSQQQLAISQANNYENLLQVEQKLQEELHVEQAIQDIARLIKQDGRTALLIVQLLRRYQLERNHQLQQVAAVQQQKQQQKQPSTPTPSRAVTGETSSTKANELNGGSGRCSAASSNSVNNDVNNKSKSYTSASSNNAVTQIVVIDDAPAVSPSVTKPITEEQPRPTKTAVRSRSHHTRTTKRKPKETNGTNDDATPKTTSTSKVDMEEIFRTVIADAANKSAEAVIQRSAAYDASSDLVPQLNGFHLVGNSEDGSNSTEDPAERGISIPYAQENGTGENEVTFVPAEVHQNEALSIEDGQVAYGQGCNNFVQESSMEDIDDLMAVLRDDQEGISNIEDGNGSALLGYTAVELANFLAASEIENSNVVPNDVAYQEYNAATGDQFIYGLENSAIRGFDHQGTYETIDDKSNSADPEVYIEPHQEQVINDVLNGSVQNADWLDNYLHSPLTNDRQYSIAPAQQVFVQRSMDAFV